MRSSIARRRRMFVPSLFALENRRLLSVTVDWYGQDGTDLVGPTTSVGPDGVQDLHLHLSNLKSQDVSSTTYIQSILIQGPAGSGFEWEYRNDEIVRDPNDPSSMPSGWANAEFFFSANAPSDWTQGDLYINPTVDSNLSSSGQPLGSSTGAPITLQNGDALTITVIYYPSSHVTFTDTGTKTVSGLASPPSPAPTTATPGNVQLNTMAVTDDGQNVS